MCHVCVNACICHFSLFLYFLDSEVCVSERLNETESQPSGSLQNETAVEHTEGGERCSDFIQINLEAL